MIDVVAALIRNNDRFLICQRPVNKKRAFLWEFPGGKVEEGESYEEALARECLEELGILIGVETVFMTVTHSYPDIQIRLTVFNAVILRGEPVALEHQKIRWILPQEIFKYSFCPADQEILRKICDLSSN